MLFKGGDNALKKRRTRGETWAPSWFSEMQAAAFDIAGWRFMSTRLEHGCYYLVAAKSLAQSLGLTRLWEVDVRGAGSANDGNASAFAPYY
jgi:hypothetical protein